MKEFDLHEAKMGAEICTREGGYAKITTFDNGSFVSPINAIFEQFGYETENVFKNTGRFRPDGIESEYDLMLK